MMRQVRTAMDLVPCTLDAAIQQYVQEFGHWPSILITCSWAEYRAVFEHAKQQGLRCYALPEEIIMRPNSWAVVGGDDCVMWSPGA